MCFCQSFMNEIYKYLASDKDRPSEEMVLASKRWGISLGNIDFLLVIFREVLKGQGYFAVVLAFELKLLAMGWFSLPSLFLQKADLNEELRGLRCVVSHSGKIAMHVLERLIAYGALPITVSDSKGYLVDEDGFDYMKITFLRDIKAQQRSLRFDVAFPCASRNEIDQSDAINLVNSGCHILVEGSNMPFTLEAVNILRKANVFIAPAMAADAGRVCSLLLQGI
ncbi:hypothetical protein Patl1_33401 [Pistacia atlantica]|uniref:Uncharacterized protein n=1 Tax=Pistacia atlantica TaxID=434234 RepID=A0ACC0ZSJ1_9ROSI|nr:hypothetical protein Patl1_33401 [Pistacia atlantica]